MADENRKGSEGQSGGTRRRGFAAMDPTRQREIASQGGRAAHELGNAHEFTTEEARAAGRLSHKNDGRKNSGGSAGGEGGGTERVRGGSDQQAEGGRGDDNKSKR